MIDATLIATAAISGGIGLAAAGLQAATSRRQMSLEATSKVHQEAEERRQERRKVYEAATDLLTDFGWDLEADERGYDVVKAFTKPFVRVASRIRIYGSPESVAAVDEIQLGFALLNRSSDEASLSGAWTTINHGIDLLFEAARNDVGPKSDDELRDAAYQHGAGPRT
jgi:hypothetical protein